MCDFSLEAVRFPASKGRRQANHPHFQLGNKGLLWARRSRNGRLSPSRHRVVVCGGSQTMGYGAVVVQRNQLQDRDI